MEIIYTILTSALVTTIVSSILAPYVLQANVRRKHQAEFLKDIINCDVARRDKNYSNNDYRELVIKLKTSSMIAGANRRIVNHYIQYSVIVHSCWLGMNGNTSLKHTNDVKKLSNAVDIAGLLLVDDITKPMRKMFSHNGWKVAHIENTEEDLRELLKEQRIVDHWLETRLMALTI